MERLYTELMNLHEHLSQGGDGWSFDLCGLAKEAADVIRILCIENKQLKISALETSNLIPNEYAKLVAAKREERLIILPVPIGAPIFVLYRDIETDGTPVSGVDEMHLSGYIKEGDREFYTTYDDMGACDIDPSELYLTRAEAEATLAEQ